MALRLTNESFVSQHGQPHKIGDITRAALVLTHVGHGYIT
jgi:hypothetical protein